MINSRTSVETGETGESSWSLYHWQKYLARQQMVDKNIEQLRKQRAMRKDDLPNDLFEI